MIEESERLRLVIPPSLDIIAFFAETSGGRVSEISARTQNIFSATMNDPSEPIYFAKLNLKPSLLARHMNLVWDAPMLTALRSVLMKPEHLDYVPHLHERVLATVSA